MLLPHEKSLEFQLISLARVPTYFLNHIDAKYNHAAQLIANTCVSAEYKLNMMTESY